MEGPQCLMCNIQGGAASSPVTAALGAPVMDRPDVDRQPGGGANLGGAAFLFCIS